MRKICLSVIMALFGLSMSAQGVLNVRINEVLVVNENDVVDDYGERESWIELFNTGYERVDLGGCYLGVRYANRRDTQGNKVIDKYYIPRNDPATKLEPLGYRLFFCEGTDTKGTFYTNFTLNEDPVDMIILYSASGKDVISVFQLPDSRRIQPDVSWGIMGHEEIESKVFPEIPRKQRKAMSQDQYLDALAAGMKYQPEILTKTTPSATNEFREAVPRHEMFRQRDPKGGVMAVTAMGVVFLALITIFLIFKGFGKIMVSRTNSKEAKHQGAPVAEKRTEAGYSGEVVAAISMALEMHQSDLHDTESEIITINRVGRMYSPWSSKIYGVTEGTLKK